MYPFRFAMAAICPLLTGEKLSIADTFGMMAIVQLFLIDELLFILAGLRVIVLFIHTRKRTVEIL